MNPNKTIRRFLTLRQLISVLLAAAGIVTVCSLLSHVYMCFQPAEQFIWYPHGDQYWVENLSMRSHIGLYLTMRIPGSVIASPSLALESGKACYLIAAFAYQLPRLILTVLYLFWARGIVDSVCRGGSPFILENVRRLRLIGICWVVSWFVLLPLLAICMAVFVTGAFSLSGMPDVGSLLIGLLVLMLAQVFRYGCSLQQAADETI